MSSHEAQPSTPNKRNTPRWAVTAAILLIGVVIGLLFHGGGGHRDAVANSGSATSTSSSVLYDADATANCLGQYTEDPAGVAPWGPGERHLTTWVPRDEADTGNYGVDLYFFTNAEDALKADGPVNGEPAYDKNETVITGNVIVTGTAVTDHYSRRLILNCLQNATG